MSTGKHKTVEALLGNTDIYLVDQIIRGRYSKGDRVLDAGCGEGRNLHWFAVNGIDVYAADRDAASLALLKAKYPRIPSDHIYLADISRLPFGDDFFDAVVSSAVLHFAAGAPEFFEMFRELVRVMKPGGTLFLRMTTIIGIEDEVAHVHDGIYDLPDGSRRFLLTRETLAQLTTNFGVSLAETFKTVLVDGQRSMAVVLFQKEMPH